MMFSNNSRLLVIYINKNNYKYSWAITIIPHLLNYIPSPQHYNLTPSQTADGRPPTTRARRRYGSRAATTCP
jgi:hypothetical protein